jgi:membrane associated rhomboid family serine protease
VFGGLVYLVLTLQMDEPPPMIGAGIALMAMLAALTMMQPLTKVVFLLFIWPIRVRLIWLTVFFFVIQLFDLTKGATLSLSMISGLIVGVFYATIEKLWIRYG